jgi:hypothetical protein
METPFEHLLTSSYKADLIRHLREHPESFEEALSLALEERPPYSWRAAWLLWSCMERNDARVLPRYGKIVRLARTAGENHQRELFKILQLLEPEAKHESALLDICMTVWERPSAAPAVRVNAFRVMLQIAERHPELFRELELLTRQQYMDTFSPAVQKSVGNLMGRSKTRRK